MSWQELNHRALVSIGYLLILKNFIFNVYVTGVIYGEVCSAASRCLANLSLLWFKWMNGHRAAAWLPVGGIQQEGGASSASGGPTKRSIWAVLFFFFLFLNPQDFNITKYFINLEGLSY